MFSFIICQQQYYNHFKSIIQRMKFLIENEKEGGSKKFESAQINKDDPVYKFYNILHPTNRIQCDVCKRDITKHTKILSSESDYCIACFSQLQQYPQTYHIINKLDFPVFETDWTADEEILMFQGLKKHGFGNWSQIADFISTNKTREDVENHYNAVYAEAPNFLPEDREVLSTRDPQTLRLNKQSYDTQLLKHRSRQQVTNYKNQRGHLTVNSQTNINMKTGTNPAQIIGYLPKRGDFEVEYDNEAELLLAEMQFNEDDTQEERQMKFKLIDIYNKKLTERIRRKEFVITRKLLDSREQSKIQKTRTKEEKQIYNMMKPFARFNTLEEHEKLVTGILKEKQIRQRIEELKEMKRRGMRTLADIQQQLENKRKKEQKLRKKGDEAGFNVGGYQISKTRRSGSKNIGVERSNKRNSQLSREQEDLCQKFDLSHRNYTNIKDQIIRQSVRQGIIERDFLTQSFKIERGTIDSIFDFLVQKQDIILK